MRVVKKEPEIYGAVRFTGLNINEIKDFVPSEILKIDIDKITQRYLIYINGKLLKNRDVIVNDENRYQIYDTETFEQCFKEQNTEIQTNHNLETYIGTQIVKAKKQGDTYIYYDCLDGFQREMPAEEFEKRYRKFSNYIKDNIYFQRIS